MTFNDVLSQTVAMLQQHGRVSYRALKRQVALDDAFLDDLKYDLMAVQRRAVDQGGSVLVWTREIGAVVPAPAISHTQEPLAYTPSYLAENILLYRSALAGERKQVTVLFADLKGLMELLAERDPKEARQLLDPVLERMMAAVHQYEGTANQVLCLPASPSPWCRLGSPASSRRSADRQALPRIQPGASGWRRPTTCRSTIRRSTRSCAGAFTPRSKGRAPAPHTKA